MESIILANGLEIDLEEAWKKLISRQFGGNAGRAFGELIQNLLDSYPSGTPWEKRTGEIITSERQIIIQDYGEGLDKTRLQLITTLGGTDKQNDPNKIGRFGIGFFSIFNPELGAKRVVLTTKCEGQVIKLTFNIINKGSRPILSYQILNENINFSTQIRVDFDNEHAQNDCIAYASRCLEFYPCNIKINGVKFKSIWDRAEKSGAYMFHEKNCDGFIENKNTYLNFSLLCKYELLMNMSVDGFCTGNRNMNYDLRDYSSSLMPYIPGISVQLNCNALNITISRDSFYMDYVWSNLKRTFAEILMKYFLEFKNKQDDEQVILANQFILSNEIGQFLKGKLINNGILYKFVEFLANAKIFRLNGKKENYSFTQINQLISKDLPLFFSPEVTNLRWLGGEFKHDFIVLPKKCTVNGGAPHFYDTLFGSLFSNIINLDTIQNDTEKLKKLIEQDIISKQALSPKCNFIGAKQINERQQRFLDEIQLLFKNQEIKEVIENSIKINIRSITPVFFSVEAEGAYISAGLFSNDGIPIEEFGASNFENNKKNAGDEMSIKQMDVLLGLKLNHPFIKYLIEKNDKYRPYYTLSYLAHELALCQRVLVPFSPFYHFIKEKLSQDMRKVLVNQVIKAERIAS